MRPEYSDAVFIVATGANGRQVALPKSSFGGEFEIVPTLEKELGTLTEIRTVKGQWFARWHEPGYLEATPWIGPFVTQSAAEKALRLEGQPGK